MRNAFLLIAFLLVQLASVAQAFEWATQKKVSYSNYGYSVRVDSDNNAYAAGSFNGPLTGSDSSTRGGFLIKYDANGDQKWAKEYYSTTTSFSGITAIDNANNVIISGRFKNDLYFENSSYITPGLTGLFIFKYDSAGNLIFNLTEPNAQAKNICVDANNNIYVAGYFRSDLDSNYGSFTITKEGFIAKYNSNGILLWAKDFYYPSSPSNCFDMTIDNFGNIYSTGAYSPFGNKFITDSVELDNTGGDDTYVAKYDQSANLLWVQTTIGDNSETSSGIAVDSQGNIFITGLLGFNVTATSSTFGSHSISGNPSNKSDIFLACYDSTGHCNWVRLAGGNGVDGASEVFADNSGYIYITGMAGSYGDSVLFENQVFMTPGGRQLFLAKYSNYGDLTWAEVSIAGQSYGNDIIGNKSGDVWLTGAFTGSFQFGDLSLNGTDEMFLLKVNDSPVAAIENDFVSIESEVSLYPNPTYGLFQLKYNCSLMNRIDLKVLNSSDENVYSECLISQSGEIIKQIDLRKQPKGLYFIEIIADGKRSVKKVVLQ